MKINESIGYTLSRIRKMRDINQDKLGKAIGLTVQTISDMENGKTNITVEKLVKIANFLGVNASDILKIHEKSAKITININENIEARLSFVPKTEGHGTPPSDESRV